MSDPKDAIDRFVGCTIDRRFKISSALGRGGMGAVYLARQSPLERQVAIKLLATIPDASREKEFQSRFFLEASTSAKLKHHNTITVFDYGTDVVKGERVFFIAMELVEGVTLSSVLKKKGALHARRCLNILLQVARSLREAHQKGIVHRDLKPGNVMLIKQAEHDKYEQDFVKVLDFGLAKTFESVAEVSLTRAGTFLGSPRYVSPEQIEGRPIDPRADIYSFGCLAYRMLTTMVPFDGDTAVEIMMKHLNQDVPPMPANLELKIPPAFTELVFDCLEKEVKNRPADMGQIITRLKAIRDAEKEKRLSLVSAAYEETVSEERAKVAPVASPSEPSAEAYEQASEEEDLDPTTYDGSLRSREDSFAEQAAPGPFTQNSLSESDLSFDQERPEHVEQELERAHRRRQRRSALALFLTLILVGCIALGFLTGAFAELTRFVQSQFESASAAPKHEVILELRSIPSGADIFEGDAPMALGKSPLRLRWNTEVDSAPRAFRFAKAQHGDVFLEVVAPVNAKKSVTLLREVVLPPQ